MSGIDLDHCLDPATGEIEPWARDILAQFSGTYAEISPSKKGVKIFVRGTVPGGIKKGNIEIYPSGRFFTVTGNRWGEHPSSLADGQEALTALYDRVKAEGQTTAPPDDADHQTPMPKGELSDDCILELAHGAKNGNEFSFLWAGKWEGTYPSQSEADLALCNLLAFYTGPHPDRIDRLFRQSGLFRGEMGRETPQQRGHLWRGDRKESD